ncbi:hypothetical protein H5410_037128 [Solanum commersonii]|uniref:Uncharacterized protein n=1 Tax=Solanum commersonii TaxID=4109 RepID=A0A9J5Y8L9_SOLCO|nr:hypothetical protein H5410_037128 [Solanum commersonii]
MSSPSRSSSHPPPVALLSSLSSSLLAPSRLFSPARMMRQIAASFSSLQSQAPSNQHQQPARRATSSPANINQRESQLRKAIGEIAVHQKQRQQRTSEILASPFLSSPGEPD